MRHRVHWHLGNHLAWRRGEYLHARVGWFAIERVPSWDHPQYGRWGLWFRYGGFTARFRDWLLMFR